MYTFDKFMLQESFSMTSHATPYPPGVTPHPRNRDFVWQPAPGGKLRVLSPGQRRQFEELGFVKVENVFPAATIAAVVEAIDPLEREQEAEVRAGGSSTRLNSVDAITFSVHLVKRSPVLREFAQHPFFKSVCHDLIGGDVRLYWDQSVYKKAGKPREFPWHQDNGYTYIEPQQYLTCWIPLTDVDTDNGCPWIAPALHKQGTFEHRLTPTGLRCIDSVPDAVCVAARAGDAIVFSSLAPHRTGPNLKAGTVRKAYILQYAPDGAIAYPRDGDGTPVPQNDPDRQFKILENGK